jgi:hypothetical protein
MSDGTVAESWARIVAVLAERAPSSARWAGGPADASSPERVRSETRLPLPADLTQWLSLADVIAQKPEAMIIPDFFPYDIDGVIAAIQSRHQVYAGLDSLGSPGQPAGTEAAGSGPEEYWLFIPIAWDGAGNDLVVDLRDGDLHGCVMAWWHERGLAARWPGTGVMLADIRDALEHGRPENRDPTAEELAHRTRTGHLAVFTADGRLEWEDDRAVRSREIVAWARSQGYQVSGRRRIPARIVQAYEHRQPP